MITCIIVDDEPLAQEVLESHIKRHGQLQLLAKCSSAVMAFELLHHKQVDLIFLDIRMPGISGISFVRSLSNPPKIIFTTAYPEYALAGFDLDAVDYLLKPVTYELFARSIQKLLRIQPEIVSKDREYTYFKVSGKLVKVMHADIIFAQSVKDYIQLQTVSGRLLTHMTMKNLMQMLPARLFARIHRSYLVNRNMINIVSKTKVQIGAETIPVGNLYRSNLNFDIP
ncbi:DNA-binding response regulator [Pedobacter yulinensis]|uniref:DNA-binding response regulator n=1 Tax=Pedobacter yulinensis TaxID=2126353 RepID=A0A2T3HMQ2_9SPHI|nr:response regulator transcription factor [Pedobacter yulinensis]PST83673.1 DNA-binding response regulator [Pedobacter yulinensis]